MRVLGFEVESPQTVVNRLLTDVGAVARLARDAADQFDRMIALGEELAAIGRGMLEIAERLDQRVQMVLDLGKEIETRTAALLELGARMQELGGQIDVRGEEIVEAAKGVVGTAAELIGVLPALDRALEMASPLEGAIDRFGRLVDRLPGGVGRAGRPPEPTEPEVAPRRRRRVPPAGS